MRKTERVVVLCRTDSIFTAFHSRKQLQGIHTSHSTQMCLSLIIAVCDLIGLIYTIMKPATSWRKRRLVEFSLPGSIVAAVAATVNV